MSIFISFPTMHDPEVINTINGIYSLSKNPQDIYVSIYNLYTHESEKERLQNFVNHKNISVQNQLFDLDNLWEYAGPSKSRIKAFSKYDGEDYILQIDSHTKFTPNWDNELINLAKKSEEIADKPIITSFLGFYDDGLGVFTSGSMKYPFYYNCDCEKCLKSDDHHPLPLVDISQSLQEFDESLTDNFYLSPRYCTQFGFSKYNFIEDQTPDPIDSFEDIYQSIELHDKGYSFLHPNINEDFMGHSWKSTKRAKWEDVYGEDNLELQKQKGKDYWYNYLENNRDKVQKYCDYSNLYIDGKTLKISKDYSIPKG